MVSIGICDDEAEVVKHIENLLFNIKAEKFIDVQIRSYTQGKDLLDEINEGIKFDLIYLDIQMDGKNGIELAKIIRQYDKNVLFIYISNYENYLKDLLEVEPFRFINKPVKVEVFRKYFDLAISKILNNEVYFHFRFNKEYYKVAVKDIVYFESKGRVIYISLYNDQKEQFYGRLNEIEERMEKVTSNFLRIHQSYLINYRYIKRLAFDEIELYNGEIFRISVERQKKIRRKACELMGEE